MGPSDNISHNIGSIFRGPPGRCLRSRDSVTWTIIELEKSWTPATYYVEEEGFPKEIRCTSCQGLQQYRKHTKKTKLFKQESMRLARNIKYITQFTGNRVILIRI